MSKATILVIDDEQSFLDIITNNLKHYDYKVIQALNGKMGCMVAEKFLPDIIVCDWEMPVMNGIEAILFLKKQEDTKDIPIIMATGGMTTAENLETALNAGAIDYIRKPIDPIELIARINSSLKLATSYKAIKKQNEKITAQALHLKEINLELEKLSIALSKTDNAVMIMKEDGTIEWINQGYTKMFGFTLSQLIKERGDNLYKLSRNPNINSGLNDLREKKKPIIYESENITRDGKRLWIQATITPILDTSGKITKLVAIYSDISNLKNAEKEIIDQRNEISYQKQEIIDSILYAKHIQSAIFPSIENINDLIPDSFIFYEPRDIIGGDFYWVSQIDEKIIIAVADCTGHGVPGALMSMLGITFLNEIVINKKISNPAEILNRLRKSVIHALHQSIDDESSRDGMDIALCVIDKKTNILQFAGANNPAIIIYKNEIIELPCDKMPISIRDIDDSDFTNKELKITSEHSIFLFSDGFIDQFGGPKQKRFLKNNFRQLLVDVSKLPKKEQLAKIKTVFRNWKGDLEQIDDVLVIGFRI